MKDRMFICPKCNRASSEVNWNSFTDLYFNAFNSEEPLSDVTSKAQRADMVFVCPCCENEIYKEIIEIENPRVFLGGTCNYSTWRDRLIPMLEIEYFNPAVEDWTPECMKEEIRQREECDYVLYVITPEMKGVYSIAEVVDDSNKKPEKTLFAVIDNGLMWGKHERKSLEQVAKIVESNGGKVFDSLESIAEYLNK